MKVKVCHLLLLSTSLGRRDSNLDTLLPNSSTSTRSTTVALEARRTLRDSSRSQCSRATRTVRVNALFASLCVVLMLHIHLEVGQGLVIRHLDGEGVVLAGCP